MTIKKILLTGGTDGIGFETAKMLAEQGHTLLLHGRNATKLEAAKAKLLTIRPEAPIETFLADLSHLKEVQGLADAVAEEHRHIDVLINNAGVFKLPDPHTSDGLDARFAVNTIAPYLLTRSLMPLMTGSGRVVNVSSAAQAPVSADALRGRAEIGDDFAAYAQSKLAIAMWSRAMAEALGADGPVIVAVNPGSLLGTKMVKQGFGTAGNDIAIGADILCRAALSEEFAAASGQYFDNDVGRFSDPHPDALSPQKCASVVQAIDAVLADLG